MRSGVEGGENHSTYVRCAGGAGREGRKTEDTTGISKLRIPEKILVDTVEAIDVVEHL
jgi:hypothetical protein